MSLLSLSIEAAPDEDGYELGWRTRESRQGHVYPERGASRSDHAVVPVNSSPCPNRVGDGLCVAKSVRGAVAGGHALRHCMIVGYRRADVLGEDKSKVRVRELVVLGDVDLWSTLRSGFGRDADLGDADLGGADLGGDAYLRDAYYNAGTCWPATVDPASRGAVAP